MEASVASRDLRLRSIISQEMSDTSVSHQLSQALGFGLADAATIVGEAIVATALIINRGVGTFVSCFDKPPLQHLLDGTVEGTRVETDLAMGEGQDFLHDAIAMLLTHRQGKDDMKYCWGQREQAGRLGISVQDIPLTGYIQNEYIHIKYILEKQKGVKRERGLTHTYQEEGRLRSLGAISRLRSPDRHLLGKPSCSHLRTLGALALWNPGGPTPGGQHRLEDGPILNGDVSAVRSGHRGGSAVRRPNGWPNSTREGH